MTSLLFFYDFLSPPPPLSLSLFRTIYQTAKNHSKVQGKNGISNYPRRIYCKKYYPKMLMLGQFNAYQSIYNHSGHRILIASRTSPWVSLQLHNRQRSSPLNFSRSSTSAWTQCFPPLTPSVSTTAQYWKKIKIFHWFLNILFFANSTLDNPPKIF